MCAPVTGILDEGTFYLSHILSFHHYTPLWNIKISAYHLPRTLSIS